MSSDREVEFGRFVTEWERLHGPVDGASPELQQQFHEQARRLNGLDPETGRRPDAVDRIPMERGGRPL